MGLSGTEAGTAVIQKPIDFRELLEHVLPLDELQPTDRMRIRQALDAGTPRGLEQAAHLALTELEHRGTLQRTRSDATGVRYASRDVLDVITVPPSSDRHTPEGASRHPRSELPAQARTGLHQIRRLLRLDDHVLFAETGHADAISALTQPLEHVGRELLGAAHVTFIPADAEADPSAIDAYARAALDDPGAVLCDAGIRAWAAVVAHSGAIRGCLEVRSEPNQVFTPEALSLVSLLAEHTADLLERAERIEKLVFVDPMTSVYNRSYFDLQLQNEMARASREKESMALCIVDVDDFKAFNTRYGYEAGNTVLTQVAKSLKHGVRPFDTVARWGGEEFGVLLTAPVRAEDVLTVCERLRALVGGLDLELTGLDGKRERVRVTVSLGVAMSPDHGKVANDLWRAANQALLIAKKPPKNQVVFYGSR